jgi:16S rRNA (guanine(966)-N(2))-methyltransferase RsmD
MRVIAGTYRSRILLSLKGSALRPTSDRLRETLFNILGDAVAGSRFIDAFAGTGAIGIEAISRGAAKVVFIESHAPAATLIRRNLESLQIRSGAQVLPIDALKGLQKLSSRRTPHEGFDFVFLDPPYASSDDYDRCLQFLGSSNLLAPTGIVIAEHRRSSPPPEQIGTLHRYRLLKQGDAALSFFRLLPRQETFATRND